MNQLNICPTPKEDTTIEKETLGARRPFLKLQLSEMVKQSLPSKASFRWTFFSNKVGGPTCPECDGLDLGCPGSLAGGIGHPRPWKGEEPEDRAEMGTCIWYFLGPGSPAHARF